jgi:hypothetical protein
MDALEIIEKKGRLVCLHRYFDERQSTFDSFGERGLIAELAAGHSMSGRDL